jgi:hemoglobin
MAEVGIADPLLRGVLHEYFTWTTTTTMSAYHHDAADVPAGLAIRSWSWDGRHG